MHIHGSPETSNRTFRVPLAGAFCASFAALLLAPALMPDSYSILLHGTSESAAQGVDGAWMARLGFVLLGLGVLWLSSLAAPRWGKWGVALHRWFAVWMIAAAAFSTRPWVKAASFSPTEDLLHTIAASVMGIGFIAGVMVVARARARRTGRVEALDFIAFFGTLLLPPVMALTPDYYGVLQRTMFLLAYAWYLREAVRLPAPATLSAGAFDQNRPLASAEGS